MPRYRVVADPFQFDALTTSKALQELTRVDPESEASYEFREGEPAYFKLVASSRSIAQRQVEEAAQKAGVTDPSAVGGAEAEAL